MLRTASNRHIAAGVLAAALLSVGAPGRNAEAQSVSVAPQKARLGEVVSSEVEISRDEAELRLELADGREADFAIRDGQAYVRGREIGPAPRGGAVDRAWRELLNQAMEVPTDQLPGLLVGWRAPDADAGKLLDAELEAALTGPGPAPAARGEEEVWSSDTVARLNQKIAELESRIRDRDHDHDLESARELRAERRTPWFSPLRHIGRGIAGILSLLAVFAVLVGLGFAAVFFGRRYLEGVADTARHATLRSGLVGLAGSFLVLPAFILGTIALVISIVGIPALLVWLPLFPVAIAAAALFGYLAVAHAAGEALAERRFYGGEWFTRANSYYYVLTGVGLLLAVSLASQVVQMGGPWLGFIHGLLTFLGVVVTWVAFTVGFGAVLLSRAGTRPVTPPVGAELGVEGVFEEESHV